MEQQTVHTNEYEGNRQKGDAVAFQCPNCSAGLRLAPDTGKFACEFCLSEFTEEELAGTDAAEKAQKSQADAEDFCAHMNAYSCPTCGAEIMADEHTAADFCCYCHNPVVLQGRLTGQMKPDKMVPFKIDEKEATNVFLRWAKKRRFAPKSFSSPQQVGKMKGIYYPFWLTDADTTADMTARATKVRRWRTGNRVFTETSHYAIERSGDIHFEDIATSALSEADKQMLEGILPFASSELKDFAPAYLTGFLAKKRNIERSELTNEVRGRMQKYATELLRDTVNGYTTVSVKTVKVNVLKSHWDYVLLPIWLLIYHGKKKDYTFALNGASGKIYGRVPVSLPRLLLLAGAVFGLAFLLFMLTGGWLG